MNITTTPKLIALVGGSGAGKTWLANHLSQVLGDEAMSLSLDDFYHDLSALPPAERDKVNFDHPDAIDWSLFEKVLRELQSGASVLAPRYDFSSHTRLTEGEPCHPRPFIFVEGLWLLRNPGLRELFDLRVFLRCSESLRWQRRLTRDLNERGRIADSICKQFWNVVAPMHDQFVKVQEAQADLVFEEPIYQNELDGLVVAIRALHPKPASTTWALAGSSTTAPQVAVLQSL